MAIGGMNTFLSSYADHLEMEMLHMSKFNPGGKISSFVCLLFSFLPLSSDSSPCAAPGSIRRSPFCPIQGSGLGDRAIACKAPSEGTQTAFLTFALMLREG